MALTVTARGTGANNSAGTSYAFSPASNFTIGTTAIIFIAVDNAGSGGNTSNITSVTDSASNTWTQRQSHFNDPGAANAGVHYKCYTTDQAGGTLTTSSTITINLSPSTTNKAYTLWEIANTVGVVTLVSDGTKTRSEGSTTASPTITATNVAANDVVFGTIAREGNSTGTADSDTTRGNWSTAQTSGIGATGDTGLSIFTQNKIVTSLGNQTYNPTFAGNADNSENLTVFTEVVVSSSIIKNRMID